MDKGKFLGSIFLFAGAVIMTACSMVMIFTGHPNGGILFLPAIGLFTGAGCVAYEA